MDKLTIQNIIDHYTGREGDQLVDGLTISDVRKLCRAALSSLSRDAALEEVARLCDSVDKSTHPRDLADQIRALASRGQNAAVSQDGSFAWLIEDTREPTTTYYGIGGWTTDHDKAIRYARKIDASRAILMLPNGWHLIAKAVEHGWHDRTLAGTAPSTEAGGENQGLVQELRDMALQERQDRHGNQLSAELMCRAAAALSTQSGPAPGVVGVSREPTEVMLRAGTERIVPAIHELNSHEYKRYKLMTLGIWQAMYDAAIERGKGEG